jgi:hypothetical protein
LIISLNFVPVLLNLINLDIIVIVELDGTFAKVMEPDGIPALSAYPEPSSEKQEISVCLLPVAAATLII